MEDELLDDSMLVEEDEDEVLVSLLDILDSLDDEITSIEEDKEEPEVEQPVNMVITDNANKAFFAFLIFVNISLLKT